MWHQVKKFSYRDSTFRQNSTSKLFYYFENQHENMFIDLSIQCYFFVHSMNWVSRQENHQHLEFKDFQYSRCLNIEIIYFFREHCQNISVFFIDRSYFSISAIISISISKIVIKFSSILNIAIIFLTREFFDFLSIYLANQHLFSVSMLDSISSLQNSASETKVSRQHSIFTLSFLLENILESHLFV